MLWQYQIATKDSVYSLCLFFYYRPVTSNLWRTHSNSTGLPLHQHTDQWDASVQCFKSFRSEHLFSQLSGYGLLLSCWGEGEAELSFFKRVCANEQCVLWWSRLDILTRFSLISKYFNALL